MEFDYDLYEDEEVPLDNDEEDPYSHYLGSTYDDMNANDIDSMNLQQLFSMCVKPTLVDAFNHVYHLLIWCLLFRITTQVLRIPSFLQDICSLLSGIIILHVLFSTTMYYIVFLIMISYLIIFITTYFHRNDVQRGPVLIIFSIIYLVVCELFVVESKLWHKIRGPQMIVVMKAVSIGFDCDIGTIQGIPSLLQYSGYMLCPGTCVFGPWTSFNDYLSIYKLPKWNFKWMRAIIVRLLLASIFLSISSCWSYFLIPDDSMKWFIAYRDALSFRTSHYFVSYLSEASSMLSGYTYLPSQDDQFSYTVVQPQSIELPRSLINVVVYWNIPMHTWLKIYIFNTNKKYGNFFAIITTYSISALLHGFNFQLGAVLLSLGVYSYVEYMLRKKLANVFNACIFVRSCRQCSHKHIWKQPVVFLTNLFFSILCSFHLAYLGVMFDSTNDEGYSYQHTLNKWTNLDFASHYVVFVTYVVFLLI